MPHGIPLLPRFLKKFTHMRTYITSTLIALSILSMGCSNDVEYHDLPIVYNGIICDNYPSLWNYYHPVDDPKSPPFVIFADNYPQYNNGKYAIVGTSGGVISIDIETGKKQWQYPITHDIVSTYFIAPSEEFIILNIDNQFMKVNLSDGTEQWRTPYLITRSSDPYYTYSHVGDSHIYIATIVFDDGAESSNRTAAVKLNLQTGDTTHLLRTAPRGDYVDTQCDIRSVMHNGHELWFVIEGLYNQKTGDDMWQVYLRDAETGDTLFPPFSPIPQLPQHLKQVYRPQGFAKYNNKVFLYNHMAFTVFDLESMNIVHQHCFSNAIPANGPSEFVLEPILIDNKLVIQTRNRQWLIDMDSYAILASNENQTGNLIGRELPHLPNNMIDGIFYRASGHMFRAFDFENSKELLRMSISNSNNRNEYDLHGRCITYKNDKGEVFVLFSNTNETFCYPGLTSSHHKMDMLDYIKNKANIR